jgi:hypothetical protein
MTTSAPHPDLAALAPLVGSWEGPGEGRYPTIEPFEYREAITITATPKPFLVYTQKTTHAGDGRPLHVETGYWRLSTAGIVELVLAHPTGIVEIQEGPLQSSEDGLLIEMEATHIGRSASAKEVTAVSRTFRLTGDTLRYEVRMAAVGEPLQFHLAAQLWRSTGT